MSDPILDKLRCLLDRERSALIVGALGELGDIAEAKHGLLGRIDHRSVGLIDLQGELRRNQALLRSAIDGLRQAALRMAELRETRDGYRAYDIHGHRATVTVDPPQMERKA